MEFYHHWWRRERKLELEIYIGGRLFQPAIRFLPACPHCHGEGGYRGSYDPPEPPEECVYCEDDCVVSYWRWLKYRVLSLSWAERLDAWLCDLRWWQEEPTRHYAEMLETVYWRQDEKPAC